MRQNLVQGHIYRLFSTRNVRKSFLNFPSQTKKNYFLSNITKTFSVQKSDTEMSIKQNTQRTERKKTENVFVWVDFNKLNFQTKTIVVNFPQATYELTE